MSRINRSRSVKLQPKAHIGWEGRFTSTTRYVLGAASALTSSESLSQAEQVSIIGDVVEHRITFEELSPDELRHETEGSWPRPAVNSILIELKVRA